MTYRRKQKVELPVCCWNCDKSDDHYTAERGWNCKENRPEQMSRSLNNCEGFSRGGMK